jgi:hypothetical protein
MKREERRPRMEKEKEPEAILGEMMKNALRNGMKEVAEFADFVWLKFHRIRRVFRRIVPCKTRERI